MQLPPFVCVLNYYGGDQLEAFYNKWLDIVYNMKPDDRPSKNSLRDTLFRKIEHSKLMHFDISRYRTFNEGHDDKTYDFLLDMIKGYIARGKQERLLKERERAVKLSLSTTKTIPAIDDTEKPAAALRIRRRKLLQHHRLQVILTKEIQSEERGSLRSPYTIPEVTYRQKGKGRKIVVTH